MQAGHGLAAAAEGVGLGGVSLFLFLLLPGASVSLNIDNLAELGSLKAVKVRSSAVVWDAQVRKDIDIFMTSVLPEPQILKIAAAIALLMASVRTRRRSSHMWRRIDLSLTRAMVYQVGTINIC